MNRPSFLWQALVSLFAAAVLSGCTSVPRTGHRHEGFIAASDGGSIYYRAEGRGPPVVLLHSAFSSSDMWEATLPALAGRRVIRIDARAHGRTPAAAKAPIAAEDVRAVMDALGIQRADLIGSSMGGATAIDFALIEPRRAGRIILAGAAPVGGSRPTAEETQPLLDIFRTTKERGFEMAIQKWVNHPMNAAASPPVKARLAALARHSPAMFAIGDISNFPVSFLQPFAMERLSELRQPILIVIGGKDLPTLQKNARRAAAELPQARLIVFETSGHFPSLEEPQRFNKLVRQFMAGRELVAP